MLKIFFKLLFFASRNTVRAATSGLGSVGLDIFLSSRHDSALPVLSQDMLCY